MYVGIDPGGSGAIAVYQPPQKARREFPGAPAYLEVWDMPVNEVTIGGSKRKRIDIIGLDQIFEALCCVSSPERIIVEQVGGMPGQSSGFAFGWGVGALHAVITLRKLRFEVVTPTKWKKEIKAPKDKKEAVVRAEEIFPNHRHLFRNAEKKGGLRPDRAEAALLAYYAATVR